MTRWAAGLAMAAGIAGCGQKGPLELEGGAQAPAPRASAPAALPPLR